MDMLLLSLAALLLVGTAVYVQARIPAFTEGAAKVVTARALLALVGIGFGMTAAAYVAGGPPQVLAFLTGFGLVHVPAAIILFVKGRRGEGKS